MGKDRQLSERHPLHQIVKYHCRGISITNKVYLGRLSSKNGSMDMLLPYGYQGALTIAFRSFLQASWKDTDFLGNIKVKPVANLSQLGLFDLRPSPAPFEFSKGLVKKELGGAGGGLRRKEQGTLTHSAGVFRVLKSTADARYLQWNLPNSLTVTKKIQTEK